MVPIFGRGPVIIKRELNIFQSRGTAQKIEALKNKSNLYSAMRHQFPPNQPEKPSHIPEG
jgi:hypothetical protein